MKAKDCVLLRVLCAAIVVCGMTGGIVHAQFPIVKLDISNRNLASQTEPGFTSFTVTDSGMDVNGVTIELEGTLDARWRGAPTGIENEHRSISIILLLIFFKGDFLC